MAVLDAVPGVEVSILINGQPVQEYDTDDEVDGPLASKTVVKYIEAVSDAEFAIKCSTLPSFEIHHQDEHDLSFEVSVDGKYVSSSIWEFDNDALPWTTEVEGIHHTDRHNITRVRPFKFSVVETVEVADKKKVERDKKVAASLGEVTVDVFRVIVTECSQLEINDEKVKGAKSKISEKAVKGRALSHGTTFGLERKVAPRYLVHCDYLDSRDNPMMRFIFRYRSKDALRKLLIIPRTPSPDLFDALSAAEKEHYAREGFRRQQGTKQEPGIKSELRLKRERSPSIVDMTEDAPRRKLMKLSMQNPVDLTDD